MNLYVEIFCECTFNMSILWFILHSTICYRFSGLPPCRHRLRNAIFGAKKLFFVKDGEIILLSKVPSESRQRIPSRRFQQLHQQQHQHQPQPSLIQQPQLQQRHVPPPAPMTKAESIGGYPPDLLAHSNFQVMV